MHREREYSVFVWKKYVLNGINNIKFIQNKMGRSKEQQGDKEVKREEKGWRKRKRVFLNFFFLEQEDEKFKNSILTIT